MWLLFARNCVTDKGSSLETDVAGCCFGGGFDKTDRDFGGTRLRPILC